ncbi:MAG: hypothetical protein U0572_09550 [Phycisphaerales bacterium]
MTDAQTWVPGPPDQRFIDDREACPPDLDFSIDEILPVVIGAHLRAEIADRPLAERLVRLIRSWQVASLDASDPVLVPIACTDLWFLNDRDLMRQPCIAIGEPGVNAATAYYASRLPKTYVIEDMCAVQFDPLFLEGSVCIWGVDARSTESAVETFAQRYLDAYLRAMHGR